MIVFLKPSFLEINVNYPFFYIKVSLNPSNSGLPTQSPLINKLVTPSTTPPPTSSSLSSLAQSSQASNAHRKLFSSIENTGSHHQVI